MDDPAFLPQPGDWKYKLAFRFPVPERGRNRFLSAVLELGAWINAALGEGPSAIYDGNSIDGETMALIVLTDKIEATFKRLHPLIEQHAPGLDYDAAYRPLKTRDWTVLWRKDAPSSPPPVPLDASKAADSLEFDDEPDWTYQLVYQFAYIDGDLEQFDKMIELEDRLIEATADDPIAEVDGHDAGSGEMNIFLLTNAPQDAFDSLRPIVKASAAARSWGYRAAYRRLDGDEFHDLWAADDAPPFRVI